MRVQPQFRADWPFERLEFRVVLVAGQPRRAEWRGFHAAPFRARAERRCARVLRCCAGVCAATGNAHRARDRQRQLSNASAADRRKRRWADRADTSGGRLRCGRCARSRSGFAAPHVPRLSGKGAKLRPQHGRVRVHERLWAATRGRELFRPDRCNDRARCGRAGGSDTRLGLCPSACCVEVESKRHRPGCRAAPSVRVIRPAARGRAGAGRARAGRVDRVQCRAGHGGARRAGRLWLLRTGSRRDDA
jgi:hypothetical protein